MRAPDVKSAKVVRVNFGGVERRQILPPALSGPGVASGIKPASTRFIWHPYIPEDEVCILASPGGVGKGLLASDIVSRLTRGALWPLSDERAPVRNVLWYEAEDRLDKTVIPRLIAAGADLNRIKTVQGADDFNKLTRSRLEKDHIGLVVISPLLSFLQIEDFNREKDVRNALEKLAAKIEKLRGSVIGIMHPNKKADLAAIERILGSVAFGNFCRSVLLLRAESDETTRLVHAKFNLSIKGNDLLFTKTHRRPNEPRSQYVGIDWEEAEENINVASALDIKKDDGDQSARQWLLEHLSDGAWHKVETIFEQAEPRGHLKNAIRQAKTRSPLIEHESRGFGSDKNTYWRLKRHAATG